MTPQELRKAIESSFKTHRHISTHDLDIDDDYDDYTEFDDDSCSDDDHPRPVVAPTPSGYVTSPAVTSQAPEEEENFYGYNCETSTGAHIKVNNDDKTDGASNFS